MPRVDDHENATKRVHVERDEPVLFVPPLIRDGDRLDTYPWRHFPDVTLERTGNTVTIVTSSRLALRYTVVAQSGPHLLLRRL